MKVFIRKLLTKPEDAGGATKNDSDVTGKDGDLDKINNIYDLAGCYNENTLEAEFDCFREKRGGCFNDRYVEYGPCARIDGSYGPSFAYSFYSSRFTLYIE